ncbi:hypothetical protein L7F22_000896 [Adiantum nelumboides]|nr:hypothetical protein [Adiantum nelumboides]
MIMADREEVGLNKLTINNKDSDILQPYLFLFKKLFKNTKCNQFSLYSAVLHVDERGVASTDLDMKQLQQAARDSLVEGLPTVRSPTGVCEPCQLGKQHRVALLKQASTRASAPLALVHTDLCGLMSTSSLSGLCYMLVLVDDFSRYTWVSFLKLKSEAFGSIRDWKAMVEKEKDLKVKSIRSDRGGEFFSENFARWCKSEGIRRQLTTPYTPSQNGVVERKNRTIMEMARAMLAHASLPRKSES